MADQPTPLPAGPIYYRAAPRRYWPVATIVIFALNLLLFGLEILAGGSQNARVLLDMGAAYGPYLRRGDYWRLVMPIFLHGGWLHLLGNSYALYILGPILERVYGYGRYALIYLFAGIGSSLLSMTVSKNVSVGASGAIMGIAAAMVVTGFLHRDVIPPRWGRAFGRGIIPFILLVLASGFTTHGIDNWGHLGGLATGVVLAMVIPPPGHDLLPGSMMEPPSQAMVAVPLVAVLIAFFGAAENYRHVQAMYGLLSAGARCESDQQFDRAQQNFQDAARRVPRDERPHEELGKLYLIQKKNSLAIHEYQEAVRLSPGDSQVRLELAMAYRLNGDLEKAQSIFEAEIGRNPRTAEEHELLANLYSEMKLYPDAINQYEEALRLEPDNAEAHNNLAWLYATCDDLKYRDAQAALDHAQRAVELTQWKEATFIDTLAEAHFVNGHYRQAVDIQRKALALDPNNTELQAHMARYRRAAAI
jgi:rhomboid protease GluP